MSIKDKPSDGSPGMDDIDAAFMASIVPDDCIGMGFLAVVEWIDVDGAQRWRVYSQMDVPITTTLGLLDLAKLELVARSDTGLPLRYAHLDEDDD